MPNLSIKDVPERWADALRRRAARNHRSLQGELMSIVESAALSDATAAEQPAATATASAAEPGRPRIVGYDKRGWPIVRQGWKKPEQVAAEMRALYPEPIAGQQLGRDMIREDRDSR